TLESEVLFNPVKVKQIQANSLSFDLAEYLDNNYLDNENNLVLRAVKLDGGEWIADEFRAVRGELIRRVGFIANYDSEVLTTPYNCSSGELSAGAEVYYVLPQEEITWPGALPLREFAGSGAWDTVVMDEVKPWLEVQAVIRV
ncbi:MAG: hypothetical protein MJ157_06470, partial [Clostridia bacterium]|nr:hypothetical protein [Clostridia bacterium]